MPACSLRRLTATLSLLALALLGAPDGWCAADLKEGYRVKIVVHVERHRMLTEVFRDQVSRELRDGLESALGELARTSVSDRHPLLADILARGLSRGLDPVRQRSPEHTHFVLIGFDGTHYRIRTRMLDGLTGVPSPVVRQASVRDRAFVARTATFLLERDLGLIGTVIGEPDKKDETVQVQLRGGGLGVDLGRWVKKGEVFALVRVEGKAPGTAVPWALLQVIEPPRDGVCRCKLFSRTELPRIDGLRAVLLGTTSGPVRLRLLQQNPNRELEPLKVAVSVQIRRTGFKDGAPLVLFPSRGKDVDTSLAKAKEERTFDKVAFVTVLTGETPRALVPVPILDDRLVVVGVPVGDEKEEKAIDDFDLLRRKVVEAYEVQAEMFRDVKALTGKAEQRAAAIAQVKKTLERSRSDHSHLTEERDKVEKEIAALGPRRRPDLAAVNERLKLLKSGEDELRKTIATLEQIDREENDPATKEWLVQKEQAKLLEAEGEIEKAIDLYEKAPEKFQTPELKEHLTALRKLRDPVDEAHGAARDFILKKYPGMSTPELTEGVAEARKALEVCMKANDVLGPVRLRRATLEHVRRLEREAGALNRSVNIDDEKPLNIIKELAPKMQKLVDDVGAYLDRKKR